ncbi:PAS domain-containing methyl-accepting chemotaxis protein (plasmid) [Thioclava litoralis]|uniref:PAS domain-containing methyl-accepting chemotaxis protein n=1 Tax=Thioclava litoralis TaxID=3076557 RepID=A0ABZ1E4V2_9RHOB|nr:PAS domain-containing methyl-accepting chemotaxis protein [Thioclava sp. FTW29]
MFKSKKLHQEIDELKREVSAFENSHAVARVDFDRKFLYLNDLFAKTFGISREDALGNNYDTLVREKDLEQEDFNEIWRVLKQGTPVNKIEPRLNAKGEEIWLDTTYSPITNKDGVSEHVLIAAREITYMHMRRRDNRSQVDALKRSMAVIEFDLKGNVLDANDHFLKATGYTIEEIRGKNHRIFMPKDALDTPEYAQFWQRLAKGSSESGQVKRVRKDGEFCWLQATYETLIDPEGRPFKVVKYAFDITEARNLAADAEGQIHAIQGVQAVIEFDPYGKIVSANDLFCKVMGYERAEIIGQSHRMFVEPGYGESQSYKDHWADLRKGKTLEGDFLRVGKNGKEVHIRASYNPIKNAAGQVVKVVKFAVDTTPYMRMNRVMAESLGRLSEGDLSTRIDQDLGEFNTLRQQFNDAISRIERVIVGVLEQTASIAQEAASITAGTTELSRRSERQAATLEESAAALEELTTSVRGAADMTLTARAKAEKAKEQSDRSSLVVNDAVTAMNEIAASSQSISRITSVIDDIAFQTNLLALNAGVEAARAGDAGRGFAVVASEVRGLAQRSSDAAREIATLIEASTRQVGRGVELVGQAGEALQSIDESITGIRDSIQQIASSAQEQSNGLNEMNSAVSDLDRAVQQNAAMAEESSAAVQMLQRGINTMSEDVGYFRCSELDLGAEEDRLAS